MTDRLIPVSDAAKLLQEFMPERDARNWLESDAQGNPVIPCILRGGQPHYQISDLAAFVQRFLNPLARLDPDEVAFYAARMAQLTQSERRSGADRRANPPLLLAPGIERRNYSRGDRRGSGGTPQGLRTVH